MKTNQSVRELSKIHCIVVIFIESNRESYRNSVISNRDKEYVQES